MNVVRIYREVSDVVVENYCCNDMKYHIDTGSIKFTETGFFIFGNHGFGWCPFCGEKISWK